MTVNFHTIFCLQLSTLIKHDYVELNGDLIDSDIELFEKGLDIGEKNLTKPALLKILEKRSTALITITEGKYHQVKKDVSGNRTNGNFS